MLLSLYTCSLVGLIFFLFALTTSIGDDSDPVLECPEGFILEGQMCLAAEYAELILDCPSESFKKDNKCWRYKNVPAQRTCPSKSLLTSDGQCETVTLKKPKYVCDDDYILVDGGCILRDIQPECPPPYKWDGSSCSHSVMLEPTFSCPPGSTAVNDNKCLMTAEVPADILCPDEFVLENDQCVKNEFGLEKLECPRGFKLQGNSCLKQQETNLEIQCPPGSVQRNKKCFFVEVDVGSFSCKKGQRLEGDECIEEWRDQVNLNCPKGTKLLTSTAQCESTVEVPVILECPPEFNLVKKKCLKRNRSRLQRICPKGFEMAESGLCISTEFKRPTMSCPQGSELEGESCSIIYEMKAEYKCPTGEILKGRVCEKAEIIPARTSCISGIPVGGNCVEHDDKPAQLSCPRGFELEGKTCTTKQVADPVPICEIGTLRENFCEVLVQVDLATYCTDKNCFKEPKRLRSKQNSEK